MKVGMIGMGKLGLPVAVALAYRGHDVMGYDLDPERTRNVEALLADEAGYDDVPAADIASSVIADGKLMFGTQHEVINHAELVFVAVQTPHEPLYDGTHPLPDTRRDFNYAHLVRAAIEVKTHMQTWRLDRPGIDRNWTLVVVSTVLPGTMRREIEPMPPWCGLVYNPSFIAMGTVIRDFLEPEFVLAGLRFTEPSEGNVHLDRLLQVYAQARIAWAYGTGTRPQVRLMSIESAELTKVAYNTFISAKLAVVGQIQETCDRIVGADAHDVLAALRSAHRRICSDAYMRPGMGDGGACHPRDNIAMSWLARHLGLSHDLYESVMLSREGWARYIADIAWAARHRAMTVEPEIVIVGTEYKPGSHLTDGSHALLVKEMLEDVGRRVICISLGALRDGWTPRATAVYLIGCPHEETWSLEWPADSVVIDPWGMQRYRSDMVPESVRLITPGSETRPDLATWLERTA